MKAGDIVLVAMPQADGAIKKRPALILREMPPFSDWLLCGISSQLHQKVEDFDELIEESAPYFLETGLKTASLIRLGFVATIPSRQIVGSIGKIPSSLHSMLLERLCNHLRMP